MPYRRTRKQLRRRRYRRTPKYTYGGMARKIWRDVRWLKSVVNAEFKYLDVNNSTTSSTTAAFVLLNGMQTGDTASTRDGQSIKMAKLFFQFTASINASATTTVGRVILLVDYQPNAAAPPIGGLLSSTTNVLSPLALGNAYRFRILRDVKYQLSANGTQIFRRKFYLTLNEHTKYSTTNVGDISDILSNSLYLVHMSDQATNTPSISYYSRLRFVDN